MKRQYATPRYYGTLGKFLRNARLNAGLTQRQVSETLGYSSAQFISNFECGIASPPTKKLKVLKDIYRIPATKAIQLCLDGERKKMIAEVEG